MNNGELRPEWHRSSSVYTEDFDWNQRLSRLSIQPARLSLHAPKAATSTYGDSNDEPCQQGASEVKHLDASIVEKGTFGQGDLRNIVISQDLRTRNLCILTLLLGISIGITSLVLGCQIVVSGKVPVPNFFRGKYITMGTIDYPFLPATRYYISGHRVFSVPEVAVLLINLLLNTGLTVIFAGMNFIQNATLRWSLCKEGRLTFNSNPRLFTGSRHFAPNWRSTNFVSAIALVLGYGSISVLTCSIYVVGMSTPDGFLDETRPVTGDRFAIDFNGWGFIGLGISTLLQGSICSWCLAKSKIVPTWSSNPFNTALVCEMLGLVEANRSFVEANWPLTAASTFATPPASASSKSTWKTTTEIRYGVLLATPRSRQPSMGEEIPRTRRFVYCLWAMLAITILWIILIVIFGLKTKSCGKDYVELMNYRTDFPSYWQSWCQVGIPYYWDPWFDRRDWAGLLISSLVLSFISLGIHCAELITDITRDEAAWRKATTAGADAGRGALTEGFTAWECWIMFAFKALTPWVFGMAFNTNLFVFSNLMPLLVLALVMLLLAVFAEHLVRRRPAGPQPSTYGNIAKLAGLVDEWNERIFWGDKGYFKGDFRIRKAGTAGQRLADLDMAMLYANLRV